MMSTIKLPGMQMLGAEHVTFLEGVHLSLSIKLMPTWQLCHAH